ncbi:MAG: M13 family metallopeptidase [Lachnospiraceae bacterium]|nr:M13 family metallopeptidase [Lachnospiraceae bacterium]
MKRKLVTLLLASSLALSMSGCKGTAENTPQTEPTEAPAELPAEEVPEPTEEAPADVVDEGALITTGGKPWIDSNLQENITEGMELSVKDDFHLYVNYDWLKNAEIEEGKTYVGAFSQASDATEEKALALLNDESLTGHDAELIQAYYKALMDWDARDAAGITPIEGTVEAIKAISTMDELSDFICDMDASYFVPVLTSPGNTLSYEDSESYITYINNDGLLLGDPAEYSERTEMGDRTYEANLALTKAMLTRLGYTEDEATAMFEDVIAFETKLAEVSLTSADAMSPDFIDKINNVYSPEELKELETTYPLTRYIEACGYGNADCYIVYEPAVIERINELYTEENLETIKNSMLIGYVTDMAPMLDNEAYDAYIEAGSIVDGSTGREDYSKVAASRVRGSLMTPMDRAYLERYDAAEKKERITKICEEVIDVYRDMLAEEEWLSDETRDLAIEKLDAIKINAVYPDKWTDYSKLDLNGLSLYECQKAITQFYWDQDLTHTNGKVDHEIWDFDILEANAYYNPQDNSINMILGLLEEPFYYDGITDEALMGSIGVVIGHEISHAFDTNGAQFDKYGNYSDWWTEEDYAAFMERADKLAAYYDGITVWEGQNVPGQNIQTEAIADITGMKAILKIAEGMEGFDYDKFFTAYAKVWHELNTREMEFYYCTQDSHPLSFLRTNVTLQQFDEFLETYDIQEGDNMYLAPEDRIMVW